MSVKEIRMANGKVNGSPRIVATAAPQPDDRDVSADGAGLSVVVIDDLAVLEKYVPAWEDLAANAIEPNAFYEPWMMMPAIHAFGASGASGAGRRLQFALVLANEPARSQS